MKTEPSPARAVFLSYASQDAEAARGICDALRAGGVEVWFDQSELVGGDAWDAKIRTQIGSCALFVPVISAATQARREGYFRLEWKLAAQRTHMMSERTTFLLPVVIDPTRDAEADVPGEFRAVQWTRLPGGETSAAFVSRVKTLLGGENPAVAAVVAGPGPAPVRPAATARRRSPRVLAAASFAIVAAIGAALFVSKKSARPTAVPAAAEKSLAVLPFTNMSDEKDNAFFADGVHEDLLTNLANLSALKVVSRASVMQYRGTTKNIREIARELGVAYVLEGSVRRAGSTIRVTGQLIKAATDEHLWAHNYDRDLKDVFAVQSELAREIAGALNAALSPAEAASLAARPTANVDAYDCYQRARVLGRSGVNANDVREKIVPLLERAVALDPNYAVAWAELGLQRLSLYLVTKTPAGLAAAKDALAHAEKITAEAYEVLAAGAQFAAALDDRELVNARRRRIIELFPNRAEAQLAVALNALHDMRVADAQASFRAALRLDPRNPEVLDSFFSLLDSIRRWDEAEAISARLIEVQPDNFDVRLTAASMAFRHTGSTAKLTRLLAELPSGPDAEAIRIVARNRIAFLTGDWQGIVSLWRETGMRFRTGGFTERSARWMVAGAFLKLGDPASSRPLLEQNRDEQVQRAESNPGSAGLWNGLGLTLGMLGERERARAALDHAAKLIAADHHDRASTFVLRWDHVLARSWVEERGPILKELDALLREPTPRPPTCNVHVLRVTWAAIPLQGDPQFEAMLNDPKNNAPIF